MSFSHCGMPTPAGAVFRVGRGCDGAGAKRLRGHLEQLGIEHDVKVYDQAGHSFMTNGHHPVGRMVFLPMRIGHEPLAAEDAYARVFDFFERQLGPPGAPAPSAG